MEMKRPPLEPICVGTDLAWSNIHGLIKCHRNNLHDTTSTRRPFNSGRGMRRHPSSPPTPPPKTTMNPSYYSHFPISSSPNPMDVEGYLQPYCASPPPLVTSG